MTQYVLLVSDYDGMRENDSICTIGVRLRRNEGYCTSSLYSTDSRSCDAFVHLFMESYSDCYRFMSITIRFLISFLRDKIPRFDERANAFRKKPRKPKNDFSEEILDICKKHAKTLNDEIELEEGQHSKKEHQNNMLKSCSRITSKNLFVLFEKLYSFHLLSVPQKSSR